MSEDLKDIVDLIFILKEKKEQLDQEIEQQEKLLKEKEEALKNVGLENKFYNTQEV